MMYPGGVWRVHDVRRLIEQVAEMRGAQAAVQGLSDLDAVRRLQEFEGNTPCFGRETALAPGPNGTCEVKGCWWRNFCDPYRQSAVPLDTALAALGKPELDSFVDFLKSRHASEAVPNSGLSVTVGSRAPLDALSRKLLIGSPQSTLRESSDETNTLRPIRLNFRSEQTSGPGGGMYTSYHRLTRDILWTADPWRIYDWVQRTRPLIDRSVLDFLPHITTQSEVVSVWKTNDFDFSGLPAPVFKQLHTPHIATADQQVLVSDPNFVPLLNLEIPYIETAELADILRLMDDFPDELTSFRNFLFSSIDKIKDKRLGSETFGADVEAIDRTIAENLRKLRSGIRGHKLKHYVELGGGALAAFSLSLYCIAHHDVNTLSVIGPGGFAYVLSGRIADFLSSQTNLRDNPVHLLWLIGESKRL